MIRAALIGFLRLYRAVVSPMYGQVCKYHPSCSAYALEAVQKHGAARGSWLAARRVLRCNPFSHGGYDPVPPVSARDPGSPALDAAVEDSQTGSRPTVGMSDDGPGQPHLPQPPATGHVGLDAVPPNPTALLVTAAAGDARP